MTPYETHFTTWPWYRSREVSWTGTVLYPLRFDQRKPEQRDRASHSHGRWVRRGGLHICIETTHCWMEFTFLCRMSLQAQAKSYTVVWLLLTLFRVLFYRHIKTRNTWGHQDGSGSVPFLFLSRVFKVRETLSCFVLVTETQVSNENLWRKSPWLGLWLEVNCTRSRDPEPKHLFHFRSATSALCFPPVLFFLFNKKFVF